MKRFVGEQSKREGFLGSFRNAETRRGQNFDARKGSGELRKDQRVVRATAGDDELVNFRFWQNETVQGINDRKSRKNCRGADEIVWLGAMAPAEGEELF